MRAFRGILGNKEPEKAMDQETVARKDLEKLKEGYERLRELYKLSVDIYQNPDEALDKVVSQVAKIWQVPIAMINLVQEDVVRFKTFVGLPPELAEKGCIDKQGVFCTYVVDTDKALVVPDAGQDPRFTKHYLVEDVGVKSYIGVPLRNFQRKPYGTLCLIDIAPHFYQPDDVELLSIFSMRVASEMERIEYIERLMKLNRELEALSVTDCLTKLDNHRRVQEELATEFERAKRQNSPMTVLFADLDDFKMINDFYGHLFGDQVLREVANILRRTVRSIDIIGRYGGDEFLVIMPNTSSQQASLIAERARAAVHDHVFTDGTNSVKVTVSMGVASYPAPDIRGKEDLVRCADLEMLRAKEQGRDRIVTHAAAS